MRGVINYAAVGGTGLQSHGACSHNLYSLRCWWWHRAARATEHAVTIYVLCVLMGFG